MPRSWKPFPLPTTLRGFLLALIYPLALTSSSAPRNGGDHPISLTSQNIRLPGNISNDDIGTRLDVSNDLKIECDGDKYGFNPNVHDCQEARAYYKRSAMPITYGQRHSGHEFTAFPLPFRLMGDQGLCYLEPVLIDDSRLGVSSINQLSDAAYELILQCAVRESKGGIATGIGGVNMGLVLGAYRPDIQCRGAFITWRSCRGILVDMSVVKVPETFGPADDPAVQNILPMKLESADSRCVMRIFGNGKADVSSWYKIWEAVTAVYAVCLKHGKLGTFRSLGELGNMFFTMTAMTPQLGNLSIFTASGADSES